MDKPGQSAMTDEEKQYYRNNTFCFLKVPPPAEQCRVKGQETDDSDKIVATILSVS